MDEHEDELDATSAGRLSGDAARIADAIAVGLAQLAKVIENGLHEIAAALATTRPSRARAPRRRR